LTEVAALFPVEVALLPVVDGELPTAVLEALLPVAAELTAQLYWRSMVVL